MATGTTSGIELSRRVNALLLEAMAQPAHRRSEFVAERCQGDRRLQAEVEAAMGADTSILHSLERSLHELHEAGQETLCPGERVGAYEIVEEIGRGGWGAVYLAQRADGEFERRVALKVLKRGIDSDEMVRRFHTERQILAQLQHPNIAQLYEGGTTEDHRPYLVMEHVAGRSIDRYCEEEELDHLARIELFLKVCAAVQVAHQNLVVHRDLKPSNILVDEAGEPKLLDFGIAKLLGPEVGDGDASTLPGARLMTPEYASPEQIRGDAITTASDVYSLGVLLYRLLSGVTPYPRAVTLVEVYDAVCEREPPAPSRALANRLSEKRAGAVSGIEARRLVRRLSGDLDSIVLHALAKKPGERYPSIDQLARDLCCYLKGHPVAARRGTTLYRAGKFLRRHARAVSVAVLVLALLIGYAVDRQIQQERTEAQRQRAEKVSAFLVELFDLSSLSSEKGRTVRALDVLDRAADKIDREMVDEPGLQAALRLTIGTGYRDLDEIQPAEYLLDQSLDFRRRDPHTSTSDLAESLQALGTLEFKRGRYREGRQLYREALAINRRLLASEEQQRLAVNRINMMSLVLMETGQPEQTLPLLKEVLAIIIGQEGEESQWAASVEGNLALTYYYAARYEESEYWLRRALDISLRVLDEDHSQVAAERCNLATVLKKLGRPEEAEPLYRQVVASYRRRLGESHPAIARVLNHQAEVLMHRGELAAAERLARQATEMWRREMGEDHLSWSGVHSVLGATLRLQGRLTEAETLAREALQLRLEVLGEESTSVAEARLDLARTLLAQGKAPEALGEAWMATETLRGPFAADSAEVALAEAVLGAILAATGQRERALELLERSSPRVRASTGARDPRARDAETALQTLRRATAR